VRGANYDYLFKKKQHGFGLVKEVGLGFSQETWTKTVLKQRKHTVVDGYE
jgi:hypothetical protein